MEIKSLFFMVFHGVSWTRPKAYELGFYWSRSEAQKGAKDMGPRKALIGGR